MRYLPPDPKLLDDFNLTDMWTHEKYAWNGFSMNGRTYIKKQRVLLLYINSSGPSKWEHILSDKWLPEGIYDACQLWTKSDYSMPLHEFLNQMFGD